MAGSLYTLAWKEALVDLISWEIIGLITASFYYYVLDAPLSTGFKIITACTAFGFLIGMLSYLQMEKQVVLHLQSLGGTQTHLSGRIIPVGYKLLFFTTIMLISMVGVILLMVYKDIMYLALNKDVFGPESFSGVFKEIVFAFIFFMVLNLIILVRYSQNLKHTFSMQVKVLEDAMNGNYEKSVPVASNDEFGIIAAKTNQMIAGLKERDDCQLNFGRYMSEEIGRKILSGEIDKDGEIHEVTMLFCDLRGYTAFVEKHDPKEVVRFLNAYFTQMQLAITAHQGVILQYIGDEIEAVFGMPIKVANHAQKALEAALDMRKRLDAVNQENRSKNIEIIHHGIGIHTGNVLAGSLGSKDRLVYAMVGDTVNVASRIQVLNKNYGTDILISKNAKDLVDPDMAQFESLGPVDIRGHSESVEIFKVM